MTDSTMAEGTAARQPADGPAGGTDSIQVFGEASPRVRRIAPDRPWIWLQLAMKDMGAAWPVSLTYGALVTGFSWLLALGMTGSGMFYLILPMCAGFMLVAPLAAVGLYETSRRLEAGRRPGLIAAFSAIRHNPRHIAYMGLVLALLLLAWIRIATLLYAVFFSDLNPNFQNLADTVFTSSISIPFFIVGTLVGAVLALVAFAISAVSIPMLLDRDTNVFTAIATSITAVRSNLKPMLLWGGLIVMAMACGMATLFIGLAVLLPLIGHATWHAYKDLVE